MLEFINKYRSSPERGYAVIGLKSYLRITKGDICKCGLKNTFTELKTVKNGAYQCEGVFRIRLCDLIAIGGVTALCLILKMKKKRCERNGDGEKNSG